MSPCVSAYVPVTIPLNRVREQVTVKQGYQSSVISMCNQLLIEQNGAHSSKHIHLCKTFHKRNICQWGKVIVTGKFVNQY